MTIKFLGRIPVPKKSGSIITPKKGKGSYKRSKKKITKENINA